ncbi:hypothetical protein ACWEJP_19465 [Streptomyces sp. NPDC004749]
MAVARTFEGVRRLWTGLLAGPLLRRLPERVFAAAGIALFALSVAARALPYDAVVPASAAGIGRGLPCVLIAAMTAVQREIPDRVLGGTVAAAQTVIRVPNAVSLALGAGLVPVVGPAALLPVAGAAGLLTALVLVSPGPCPLRRVSR